MSWRTVIISRSAKLDYHMGFMVVRSTDENRIFLSEVSCVIVETTAVSITAALMCEMMKKKIKVIFCDEARNPCSELVPYYGSHDTSIKIRNQMEWSKEVKLLIWTEIVSNKILHQANILKKYGVAESEMLLEYLSNVEYGDATNREGHSAKVYFNALFGKEFTRTSDSSINACLNYGYSIILSMFNREITANGYITQIGIFHDNMFNPFNLASDLMEPFRPLVDSIVKNMNPSIFEKEEKIQVLKLLEYEVIIANRKEVINNAIKIYCKSIFDALNEKDASLIKFFRNEL